MTGKKKSRGIQAVIAGAGSVGTMAASIAAGTEGKTRLVLTAVSSVLALVAAFSHPPRPE
jgi:threonine dehydrogenase-like Zn-dependent dehydrogenase